MAKKQLSKKKPNGGSRFSSDTIPEELDEHQAEAFIHAAVIVNIISGVMVLDIEAAGTYLMNALLDGGIPFNELPALGRKLAQLRSDSDTMLM